MKTPARTLIVYQSRTGTTKKISEYLGEKLKEGVTRVNLKDDKLPDLNYFDTVIIGGSIRATLIQSGLKKFIEKNKEILLTKKLGLFLCCMEEGETAVKQFNDSFPDDIRSKARAKGFFGGEFNFDKLNFLERAIVKKVSGVSESVSNIDYKAVDDFVLEILN